MDAIKEAAQIDFSQFIIWGFLILVAVLAGLDIIGRVSEYINKPVKWVRNRKIDHDLLVTTAQALNELKEKQERDVEASITHDKKIEDKLENITKMMQTHMESDDKRTVATFRSALYRMHSDFTERGYITREGLKTFVECGNEYEDAGGDDVYHDKLKPEVMRLPIREDE